eukprot:6440452-Lingulodinium_polyedra.AAC.1
MSGRWSRSRCGPSPPMPRRHCGAWLARSTAVELRSGASTGGGRRWPVLAPPSGAASGPATGLPAGLGL